ncbi:hypothetical protein CEXT_430651 [Caerostris extrusa]|uniref:Uncharacterized protein n=1 Tax=Caerostris extrusa TaxID=172846 RepID=A0AAV4V8T8_CAEEX|nr:hypothetical protein CEXT_430651 [Caerostris extrusa]
MWLIYQAAPSLASEPLSNETEMLKGNDSKINFCNSGRIPDTRFSLDHNLLTSLGPALRNNPVWRFSMADNLIAHLGPEDLQVWQLVRHLELQGNVIAQVERLTFANVRDQLLSLDLSRNRIESLQGCLQNLTNLQVLNLSQSVSRFFCTQ